MARTVAAKLHRPLVSDPLEPSACVWWERGVADAPRGWKLAGGLARPSARLQMPLSRLFSSTPNNDHTHLTRSCRRSAATSMFAFARAVVRSLNIAIHAGHYTVADSFKRILPKARELVDTIAELPDGVRSNHRIGHPALPYPDLPYDVLGAYIADHPSMEVNCYTTGIINVGHFDKHITFRYKYMVRLSRGSATSHPHPYGSRQTSHHPSTLAGVPAEPP